MIVKGNKMIDLECSERGSECKVKGPQVCRSAAGFYIGYYCPDCGPYDRVSTYFPTEEVAERALQICEEIS
tara:strand:- start:492 stop:704 length:213 start_codon:yes stop_codon:yes gene_type:complete